MLHIDFEEEFAASDGTGALLVDAGDDTVFTWQVIAGRDSNSDPSERQIYH